MIELLVVITIIALLIGLLLPAVNGAMRAARNAAVNAEINQMAQALASFKSKYGDYPPSRILLNENGTWNTASTTALASLAPASSSGETDINAGQLAQRSVSYIRKFWPKVATSTNTSAPIFPTGSKAWYDFNGNGTFDTTAYVLQGHECLVFFLGGIPTTGGVAGFSKNPQNPFQHDIPPPGGTTNPMYGPNRQPPMFEFDAGRLALSPGSTSGIPGYYDSLKTQRFYAYFSAYGGNAYDPNDCNFDAFNLESDGTVSPAGSSIMGGFLARFPVYDSTGAVQTPPVAISAPPNPYTATVTTGSNPTYLTPNSFQILSAGADGEYGIGGLYNASNSTPLPLPASTASNSTDTELRIREKDNLTNFHGGRLD